MSKISNKITNEQGYNVWSSFYDVYPNPTIAMDERYFPRFWLHHSKVKVLEIGCGTGRHTQKLVHNKNTVTALDMSVGMLKIAREKIQSPDVTFIQGDFFTLELPDFDYDIVIESLVLEHIENLKQFFLKASTHLKTGGDLYLSEVHPERTQNGVFAHFKPPGSDEDVHLVSYPHTEEDIVTTAAKCGLKLVSAEDVLGDEVLAKANPKWEKHLGKPMVRIWHFSK